MTPTVLELLRAHHKPHGTDDGKSQNMFKSHGDDHALLAHVTNRLSSHDFPLGFEVALADQVQFLETVFWKKRLEAARNPTDLMAYGPAIDPFLHPALRGNRDIWKTTSVVMPLTMQPYEIIPRANLTGSAWRQYRDNDGIVYGRQLPPNLEENDPLPDVIVTYTDKAPRGQHDTPQSSDEVEAAHPEFTPFATALMSVIKSTNDVHGRVHFGDTKGEVGHDVNRQLRWGDQIGTTHTSRIWELAVVKRYGWRTRSATLDKDLIRWKMEELGIKNFDPGNPEHRKIVLGLIPDDPRFLPETSRTFLRTVPLIMGMPLELAQHKILGIPQG